MRVKNILKNLAVLLGGCLVALALMELGLRFYHPLEIRFKPDRIVLPVNKKYVVNNAGKFTKLDKVTYHTKNSLGFRGAPPPPNFADYLTLVTIGGSTTECFYLSDGQTWPDLLGEKLSREFKRVWVNNAGLDGATTKRHLILMEDYLDKLKPKLVLFLVGINDIGLENGKKDETKGISKPISGFFKSMANRSEVYSLGQNIYRYFVAQRRGLHHTEINYREAGAIDRIPPEVAENLKRRHREKSLPSYEQRLQKLVEVSRKNGMEPVFMTQPVLYGQGVDPVTGVDWENIRLGENLNGKLMYEIVELYNDAVRQVARREDVGLIDLAREMPKNSAYYYDYLHYTPEGSEKVAEIVYGRLGSFIVKKFDEGGQGPTAPAPFPKPHPPTP